MKPVELHLATGSLQHLCQDYSHHRYLLLIKQSAKLTTYGSIRCPEPVNPDVGIDDHHCVRPISCSSNSSSSLRLSTRSICPANAFSSSSRFRRTHSTRALFTARPLFFSLVTATISSTSLASRSSVVR